MTPSPTPARKKAKAWPERIRAHWSKPIYTINPPLELYGVYTYVITARSEAHEEAFERYKALAEAAQSHASRGDFSGAVSSDRSARLSLNQFLIPCKSGNEKASESYCPGSELDVELSKRILSWILLAVEDEVVADRLGNNPGPFLLSTAQPIDDYASGELVDILYADLSLTPPVVMSQVVSAYKKKIQMHEEGSARLKSLKVGVLSTVTNAIGYVHMFLGKWNSSG